MMLNVDLLLFLPSMDSGHAARMFTPGPMMSGFRMPGLARLGPREEKEATVGAFFEPITVPLNWREAVGDDDELM